MPKQQQASAPPTVVVAAVGQPSLLLPSANAPLAVSHEPVTEEQIQLGLRAEEPCQQAAAASTAGEPEPAAAALAAAAASPVAVGPEALLAAAHAPQQLDVGYLQSLIEQELGPPKFPVPKHTAPPPPSAPVAAGPLSLEELLHKEFGPPKFAVPKPASPSDDARLAAALPGDDEAMADAVAAVDDDRDRARAAATQPSTSASPAAMAAASVPAGSKRSIEEEAEEAAGPAGTPALVLRATAGPALGQQFVVDNENLEARGAGELDATCNMGTWVSGNGRFDACVRAWRTPCTLIICMACRACMPPTACG